MLSKNLSNPEVWIFLLQEQTNLFLFCKNVDYANKKITGQYGVYNINICKMCDKSTEVRGGEIKVYSCKLLTSYMKLYKTTWMYTVIC